MAAFVDAARAMWSAEVPRDAGAISYFSLFILIPAVLVLFAILDAVLGAVQLRVTVVQRIVVLFPGSSQFLQKNLANLTDPPPAVLLSCCVVVIWGSTWIFTFLENALNRAWGVPKQRTFWESRIRSIALLFLGGTLLLTVAGIAAGVGALQSQAARRVPAFAKDPIINAMWYSIILGMGFLIAITVFFFIYKLMPDRKVHWHEALSGAVVATILWEAGSYIFGKFVPVLDSQRVYGTMGAIMALLAWVYTSSLITLYGANFSARLHRVEADSVATPAAIPEESYAWNGKVRIFPRAGR